MRINIVCVGKIKEKYLKLGIDEFKKRLSKYCKLDIIELDDEKAPENLSDKEMEMIKDKEGKKILSKIKDTSYVIALAIDGKNLSSEELADTINKLGIRGVSNITFVIGGSLGLSDEVLSRADYKLSFSKMTFPHQLMRLILLEQVYRSYRINNGEPYHK
ncbi:23S rRNA (pseudouridine(1915)-N(3))-methyltransferase RlmH [Intestinibacter sp.]|uniref:23S rRNA (pseudouridine(1915)-N(3))-methyltransferase RlmH n=1 Tax=Intestinibacter sp. TaxID=1965304 RepID=UPI003F164EB7